MKLDERGQGGSPKGGGRNPGMLRLIAILKLLKTLVLFAVAGLLLRTAAQHGDGNDAGMKVLNWFGFRPGHHLLEKAIDKLGGLDEHKMVVVGLVSVGYGLVFLVEGTGLLLQKRWAEYLTAGVTASLLPFEIYEITRHASVGRWLTLGLNAAVVIYLVVRLWSERRERGERRGDAGALGRRTSAPEAT